MASMDRRNIRFSMRPARDDDVEWLYELHRAAMGPHVQAVHGRWDDADQRERFAARTERDVRIVEVGDVPVGAVHLDAGEDDTIHIGLIEIHPEWQRLGIGEGVLRALDEEAARAGLSLTLRVRHGNEAIRLYERVGFTRVREDETHVHLQRS